MRLPRTQLLLSAVFFGAGTFVFAQDTEESVPDSPVPESPVELTSGPPVVLNVARQHLKNFLVDETALAPFKTKDGGYRDLESVFTIGADGGHHAIFWDPVSCRLLGALDLNAPQEKESTPDEEEDVTSATSPYTMLASGDFPLGKSSGAYGRPEFFGFRMTDGKPSFLYTYGKLVVEEIVWLENGGDDLKQMFTLRDPKNAVTLQLPAAWVDRAKTSVGEWKENVLSLPAEDATQFVITYRLSPETPEPEESN